MTSVVAFFAAVLLFLTASGCTVVGYGIGASADSRLEDGVPAHQVGEDDVGRRLSRYEHGSLVYIGRIQSVEVASDSTVLITERTERASLMSNLSARSDTLIYPSDAVVWLGGKPGLGTLIGLFAGIAGDVVVFRGVEDWFDGVYAR